MEWKFWDRAHNMLNFVLLCSPSLRETNMFAEVGLKLGIQILWVLHHPLNHTWARNTNASTPTQNMGSHIDMVYVGVCLIGSVHKYFGGWAGQNGGGAKKVLSYRKGGGPKSFP